MFGICWDRAWESLSSRGLNASQASEGIVAENIAHLRSQIANTSTSESSKNLSVDADAKNSAPLNLVEGTTLLAVNLAGRRIQGTLQGIDFSGSLWGIEDDGLKAGVDFSAADLDGADLSNRFKYQRQLTGLPSTVQGANLSDTKFELDGSTTLKECNLSRCYLYLGSRKGAPAIDLSSCIVTGSILHMAEDAVVTLPRDLTGCKVIRGGSQQINVRDALVVGATLSRVNPNEFPDTRNLHDTRFLNTSFPPLDLSNSNLRQADFSSCDLMKVTLPTCLHGVVFSNTQLAPGALKDKDLRGCTISAMALSELPKDLSETRLERFDLCGVDLREFNLDGATFSGCKSDEKTILPDGMSRATFENHSGPIELSNADKQYWKFSMRTPAAALLQNLGPNITLESVDFVGQDLSSCDMRGWRLINCSFEGCTLPGEVAGSRWEGVHFAGSNRMPHRIVDSYLSNLIFEPGSSVVSTDFSNNSYNGVVHADTSAVPQADALDAAAARFFHMPEISADKLSQLIPLLAPEFNNTYCLFWPRLTQPRHVHELYMRRVTEDTWLVTMKDDEVALNGSISDETFIVTRGKTIERLEQESRSNISQDVERLKNLLTEDLKSILGCKPSAGRLGPFMRVVDDAAGTSTTHYFRTQGLPAYFAQHAENV